MPDLVPILLLAVGLSMDAFAVSVTVSTVLPRVSRRHVFRLTFHFGLFQGLMPVVGWAAGHSFEPWIASWDHWLAFGILVLVGARAVHGALVDRSRERPPEDPTRGFTLVGLSLATSIDALAVGVSIPMLGVPIVLPAIVIGITATLATSLGMLLGDRFGPLLGRRAQIIGGLFLIGVACHVLVSHVS